MVKPSHSSGRTERWRGHDTEGGEQAGLRQDQITGTGRGEELTAVYAAAHKVALSLLWRSAPVWQGAIMVDYAPPDFGADIREARRARSMTLDALARESGVSKSVLSQIERGQTNPTVATLFSIARALDLDPSTLFGGARPSGPAAPTIVRVSRAETPVMADEAGGYRLTILNPPEMTGTREVYRLQLEPGGVLDSRPHAPGAREQLTVLAGAVEVQAGTATETLGEGDSARYAADIAHCIRARGRKAVDAILLVSFC